MATSRTLDQFKSSLSGKGYSDSQLEGAYDLIKSGTSVNDVVNLLNRGKSTTTSTQTPTTTPTNTSSSGTINQNKTSSNNGVGNYSTGSSNNAYTSGSGTINNTKTYTTTSGTQTNMSDIAKSTADMWNSKSYEEQQDLLKKNPQLQTYLQQNGLTLKRETEGANQYNVDTRPESIQPNKPEQSWDYQSNEEWRTQEVIQNLDWYKRNNPSLFSSWENYKSFFIDGKNRSPEQEQLVAQYYRDYQKYKPYDNMTGSDIGVGLANGTIPSDYLDYLKNNDPVKYGEAMEAMKGEQTKIGNQASYESMLQSEGIGSSWAGTTANKDGDIKDYYAWSGIFKDEDSDGVDDRLYVAPSEEEKQNVDRINQLLAQKQRIQDEIDANYEELVKQYPGASSSTLRAMANDQSANLNKELKELTYQLTQLQGNVSYMQNERNTQMEAGYKSIGVLQKDLGMYYDYSAQGISDLAQAKYAATNVSFTQADKGTYTQKQMALESVLSPIYEQYGSIIQRPQAQVINDIINYAQEKGIGLEQAFNENFMNQLKSKPEYKDIQNLSVYGKSSTDTGTYKTQKLDDGTTIMYNDKTGKRETIDGKEVTGISNSGVKYTPVGAGALSESLANLQSDYPVDSSYANGWCGELVNKYLSDAGSDIHLGNEVYTKTKYINSDIPEVGDVVVYDFSNAPANADISQDSRDYGHVAIITKVNGDGTFEIYQQNGDGKHKVGTATANSNNPYIAGYINPSKVSGTNGDNGTAGDYTSADYMDYETGVLNFIPIQLRNTEKEAEKIIEKIKSYYDRGISQYDAALIQMGFNVQSATPQGKEVANKIIDSLSTVADGEAFDTTFMTQLARAVNNGNYDTALNMSENMISNYLQSSGKTGLARTDMESAAVALSSLNKFKASNYWRGAKDTVAAIIGAEGSNSAQFEAWQSGLITALEGLGYSEEQAKSAVPTLGMKKEAFENKMSALQTMLLDTYNRQRSKYGLPAVSLAVLLGNQSLATAYGINAEGEALNVF